MSAHLKSIVSSIWKMVYWPIFTHNRNNRLFWTVLLGSATLLGTTHVIGGDWLDVTALTLTAFLTGHDWSAWWHRIDEIDHVTCYQKALVDEALKEYVEAENEIAELKIQIQILIEELEKYRA